MSCILCKALKGLCARVSCQYDIVEKRLHLPKHVKMVDVESCIAVHARSGLDDS